MNGYTIFYHNEWITCCALVFVLQFYMQFKNIQLDQDGEGWDLYLIDQFSYFIMEIRIFTFYAYPVNPCKTCWCFYGSFSILLGSFQTQKQTLPVVLEKYNKNMMLLPLFNAKLCCTYIILDKIINIYDVLHWVSVFIIFVMLPMSC